MTDYLGTVKKIQGLNISATVPTTGQVLTAISGTDANWQTPSVGSSNPFFDNTALVKNNIDNTKLLVISASNISTATTRTLNVSDANSTIVCTDTAQTLSNKTLVDSSTTFSDDLQPSKQARLQLASITAGQTRTMTVPDNDGTIVATTTAPATNQVVTWNGTTPIWAAPSAALSTSFMSAQTNSTFAHPSTLISSCRLHL